MQCAKWLASSVTACTRSRLRHSHHVTVLRTRLGLPHWSLSQFLKHKVKNAIAYITAFEEALAREAHKRGLDEVVCGHIHKAEIRDIDGIVYCNDGDWVESLTALVETIDGELRIVRWHEILDAATSGVDRAIPPHPIWRLCRPPEKGCRSLSRLRPVPGCRVVAAADCRATAARARQPVDCERRARVRRLAKRGT